MWKRTAGAQLTSLVLTGLVLTGCGTSSDAGAPVPQPGVADASVGMAVEAQKPNSVVQRSVITTAQMSVRVEAVDDAVATLTGMVTANEGLIEFQDFANTPDGAYATVTARIPSTRLDDLIDRVGTLGDVTQVSRQASDVTQQTVDLDARIAALEASIARLRELLGQTTNVADLVAVETELSNRQAELDSLTAQRAYLASQVSMSTLTVSLQQSVSGTGSSPGFVDGIRNGWSALVTLAGALVTSIGFLLPFVALGLLGLAVVWILVRAVRRRRS